MSKTIKFNLICDHKPIRTIEDLQENFSIEDVLNYYNNGLLQRWLTVRGYQEELKKVSDINDTDPLSIIQKLIRIFNIASSEADIKNGLYIMEYHKSQMKKINDFSKDNAQLREIILTYIGQYAEIIDSIQNHSDDMPYIKTRLQEIIDNYQTLFRFTYLITLTDLFMSAPMTILAMLTRKEFRQYILSDEIFKGATRADIAAVGGLNLMATDEATGHFYNRQTLDKILGNNLKIATGATDGYWKDVEPKEKKILVLRAGRNIRIRSAGKTGEEILYNDYMKKFLILNGLDYKCNSNSDQLCYMEV